MKLEEFMLERTQSLWENTVKYNLTESGVHPYSLKELLNEDELEKILTMRLGYGQTNGPIELRKTISSLYPGADLDNVLVTNGSAEANFLTIWSLLEPNDELIFMLPNYMQIFGLARSFGINIKPFHLKEELNWQPDIDELKSQITLKTKMIAICNPNNPTGAVLSKEAMKAIVHLARKANVWLYVDEIYRGAELSGKETPTFLGQYEKVIVNGGLAKAYALQGLRIGWLVGPKKFIEKAWSYSDYTTIATNLISQRVATLILQPELRKKVLSRNRKLLSGNLGTLVEWVKKHKELFHFIPPHAGGMAFLRYNIKINSTELSTKLREEKDVFVVAGDCFGMDNYIRLGIGSEKKYFLAGLDLIDELLREIS
ncbi:MAG: aminotransferase class I/II-fold pyridoxal phosphate-dependent enzyme [Candidatus Lokiarchaeota archaeon]|nr:aminotransferase class I/II-fold pyridoxal phosphate-dependent enzyme [Candidatus Lokiarchaeota archaeon]